MKRLPVRSARRRLLALTALRWLSVGLFLPVITLAFLERGIALAALGLVFGAMSLSTVALEIPTGGLADGLGRRPVLLAARVATIAAFALMLAGADLWVLVPAGVILGAARALDTGPLESWYVDLLEAAGAGAHVEQDLARVGLVTNLAIAGGSLLAGVAATVLPTAALPFGWTPLDVPIALALGVAVIDAAAVAALMSEARRGSAGGRGHESWQAVVGALTLARRRRPVRALLGAELLWGVAIVAVEILWQPRIEQLWPGVVDRPLLLGVVAALGFGAGAVGAVAAEWAARRWPAAVALSATLIRAGQGLAVALLALAGGLPLLITAYALSYVGNGGAAVLWVAMLHRQASSANRSSLVSVGSVVAQAGGGVGSVAFPVLATAVGIGATWALAGAVLVLSAPMLLRAGRAAAVSPAAFAGEPAAVD